jgi:hypothetical protein
LTGILLGERGHFALKRAHDHYSLSMMAAPDHTTPGDDIVRLLFATLNNQIVICMEFGIAEQSGACLQICENILNDFPFRTPRKLEIEHEVLLNLMVLSRQEVAAAA